MGDKGTERQIHRPSPAPLIARLLFTAIGILALRLPVSAQTGGEAWSTPINLSHSGAASAPVVIPTADGEVRVFWWDQFDGLTMAEVSEGEWSAPVATPISVVEALERPASDGSTVLYTPIHVMPHILGDPSGSAHALWIAEPDDESGATALLYAQLPAGRSTWSNARVIADSAAGFSIVTDADSWLYLAYSRNQHTDLDPSAIVFLRSPNGGDRWTAPAVIHSSLYYRSASADRLNIRIAADAEGLLVLTWNDPHLEYALLSHSMDVGDSWREPVRVGSDDTQAVNARPFISYGEVTGETRLLWEGTDNLGGCALYQSTLDGIAAGTGGKGRRVLDGLNGCPSQDGEQLLPLSAEQTILLNGGGTDTLALSVWNGEAWSEPKRLAFRFENPITGAYVYLGELHGSLVFPTPEEDAPAAGAALAALAVVGVDADGDVWFTESQVSALDVAFAPPSPWSEPVALLQASALPDVPAVATDPGGGIHALWSEPESAEAPTRVLRYARWSESGWTRTTTVLQSMAGSAVEPSIALAGDHLHAVWSDGPDGQIWYSRAFSQDAYAAGGWEEPRSLPGPTSDHGIGSWPQIVWSEADRRLHAVYAVPVNEDRGIYYTTSDDEGATWSATAQVFDAAGAGWAVVDYPRLAVDVLGKVHVVWIRGSLSADAPSLGVYYAFSADGGASWSERLLAAEGAYGWPAVVTDGLAGVHLFWNQSSGARSWWHQWSPGASAVSRAGRDTPHGWVRAARVPGFGDVAGPLAIIGDGALGIHFVGLGLDSEGEPALLYQTWSTSVQGTPDDGETVAQTDGQWGGAEAYRLDPAQFSAGVSAALQPDLERLDVLYRAETATADSATRPDLWHTSRTVWVTTLSPEARLAPGDRVIPIEPSEPTVTSPLTSALETPALRGDLTLGPPPASGGQTGLVVPLLVSGGLAAVIVIGVFGSRLLAKRQR